MALSAFARLQVPVRRDWLSRRERPIRAKPNPTVKTAMRRAGRRTGRGRLDREAFAIPDFVTKPIPSQALKVAASSKIKRA
jgi:hypothetical protein